MEFICWHSTKNYLCFLSKTIDPEMAVRSTFRTSEEENVLVFRLIIEHVSFLSPPLLIADLLDHFLGSVRTGWVHSPLISPYHFHVCVAIEYFVCIMHCLAYQLGWNFRRFGPICTSRNINDVTEISPCLY